MLCCLALLRVAHGSVVAAGRLELKSKGQTSGALVQLAASALRTNVSPQGVLAGPAKCCNGMDVMMSPLVHQFGAALWILMQQHFVVQRHIGSLVRMLTASSAPLVAMPRRLCKTRHMPGSMMVRQQAKTPSFPTSSAAVNLVCGTMLAANGMPMPVCVLVATRVWLTSVVLVQSTASVLRTIATAQGALAGPVKCCIVVAILVSLLVHPCRARSRISKQQHFRGQRRNGCLARKLPSAWPQLAAPWGARMRQLARPAFPPHTSALEMADVCFQLVVARTCCLDASRRQ